jgi:glycosyltransferase involved in cell wall biosynthesis
MKFDLVHVHTERANFLYGLTCGLLARRAVVRTIHSNFLYGGRVRLKLRVQRRLLRALGIRHIAISRGVQDNEQGRYGNASRLIYNWFDTSRFAALAALDRDSERQRWHLAHDQIAVLVLGNCSPIKNHLAVVEALARLRPPSGSNVVILHAGLEDAARTEWNRARQLGVDGRIRFLGKVDDVPSLMVASDLYLMPSLHEGFSIAGLEALGAGLPGILSDRPGLADLREFFSGLVYTGVTPEAVATGLETAVATLPALLEQASGNRDKARQCFSPKRGVSEYAEVYREAACRN